MPSLKTAAATFGLLVSVVLTATRAEESPSTPFSVMTYNIENGGAQVDFSKTVEAIRESGADVVGIQEAWGNTARLAEAVGWKYYDQRQHLMVWPTTKFIEDKGLIDSFRQTHPNPERNPIDTWPSGRPFVENTIDGFNPSKDDLPDRVDFIFTGGPSKIIDSRIIGEPEYKGSDIHVTPWPSDHRAVVSRFGVTPAPVPAKDLTPPSARIAEGKPEISVSKDTLHRGEELVITWRNAPGDRYDYIRITPVGTKRLAWGEAIRLYTRGELDGSVKYNAETVKGNWLDWYRADDGHWPLTPGEYDVKLMLDDGFTELAATKVKIVP
jgi:hypothetical protein